VVNGRVYFGAFNGKFYCLDQQTLEQVWCTDLRNADPNHNQPVTNIRGGNPPAVMWSSPVMSDDGTKLYVGIGEGENPQLYSFVCCLDTQTGNLVWIFCTNLFQLGKDNEPNVLPTSAVLGKVPPPFSVVQSEPVVMGCSVWGSIAFDKTLDRIYCPTGNQQPEPNGAWAGGPFNPELPSPGYSNGLLSLDASSGAFKEFFQVPPESNYRPSDIDVDVGSSPVLFDLKGRRVVGFACKNGTFFWLDADTLEPVNQRQLLPFMKDGSRIPTVDPHPDVGDLDVRVTNEQSDVTPGENYSGPFNTAAIYPGSDGISARLFIGMGGPNYHAASPGIDSDSTPFMRAIDAVTLADAWPMDSNDPPRYAKARPPMYTNAGESGLSSPTVVNDVVFCTTTQVSVYAFDVRDGTPLWQDALGMQTDGYKGGYGYCIGAAVWKNYVVAGGLLMGKEGGVLRIYRLPQPTA
jgi:glucose dehydrogenase